MHEIMMTVLQGVVSILLAVAGIAGPILAKHFAAKYKIDVSEKQLQAIRNASQTAVRYASEEGARRLKLEGVDTGEGAKRLEIAMGFMQRQFPKALPDDLHAAIHAELAATPGVGAHKPAFGSTERTEPLSPTPDPEVPADVA